ncbi:MAG: DUF2938 domain-containing protein [Sneathiella sp.]
MELDIIVPALFIGVGATLVMDLWAVCLKLLLKIPSLNYAMVGRWFGHIPQGRFIHQAIGKAPSVRGEFFIGWASHYVIGIIFAATLLAIWGADWALTPTLIPALIVGICTVAAPFLILQPGMGAGIAASKTPNPAVARRRSLMAHTSFGVGLYLAALLYAAIAPLPI